MVIDDFPRWSDILCSIVQEHPTLQVVSAASSGEEAIERAQQLQPDLILSDISLPEMNGIEAARRIRSIVPHSKILFVSANNDSEIVQEALRAGACGYILKSRVSTDLLPAIGAVLGGQMFVSLAITTYERTSQS